MTEEEAIQDLKQYITASNLKFEQRIMARMDDQFDGVDKHFTRIDQRVDDMDRRFDHLESRFDQLQDLLKQQTERIIAHIDRAYDPSTPKPITPTRHQESITRPTKTNHPTVKTRHSCLKPKAKPIRPKRVAQR